MYHQILDSARSYPNSISSGSGGSSPIGSSSSSSEKFDAASAAMNLMGGGPPFPTTTSPSSMPAYMQPSAANNMSMWNLFGSGDDLGLSKFVFPVSLAEEMNRLFVTEPATAGRRRLGSGDSQGSGNSHLGSLLSESEDFRDEFRTNGVDTDLDDLDQMIQKNRPTRAEELLGVCIRDATRRTPLYGRGLMERNPEADILTKEDLLAILSRGARGASMRPAPVVPAKPATIPRKKGNMVCVFCRNNGEAEAIYQSHILKDSTGRVLCPVLRAYTCPNCHASGDDAHTLKYCPLSNGEVPNIRSLKTARTATGKKRALP